jgi:hypothetical protein
MELAILSGWAWLDGAGVHSFEMSNQRPARPAVASDVVRNATSLARVGVVLFLAHHTVGIVLMRFV